MGLLIKEIKSLIKLIKKNIYFNNINYRPYSTFFSVYYLLLKLGFGILNLCLQKGHVVFILGLLSVVNAEKVPLHFGHTIPIFFYH